MAPCHLHPPLPVSMALAVQLRHPSIPPVIDPATAVTSAGIATCRTARPCDRGAEAPAPPWLVAVGMDGRPPQRATAPRPWQHRHSSLVGPRLCEVRLITQPPALRPFRTIRPWPGIRGAHGTRRPRHPPKKAQGKAVKADPSLIPRPIRSEAAEGEPTLVAGSLATRPARAPAIQTVVARPAVVKHRDTAPRNHLAPDHALRGAPLFGLEIRLGPQHPTLRLITPLRELPQQYTSLG
ncbi:hypothetical protein ZWY2020_051641 [Hordeum vulgare]|nr:hypothetical protein ZWY2020_051641 [Hordeum vulgare]